MNPLLFLRNTFSRNDNRKLKALSSFGHHLFPNYRFCWPQIDWWNDPKFNNYLKNTDELSGFNTHRKLMLSQLLRLTVGVPGDTVECGVFLGASSILICESNEDGDIDRTHHCFDSFEGLSAPSSVDGEYWSGGDLDISECDTVKNLESFEKVKLYKGWIPDRFEEVNQCVFSFVHIDVDLYDPTKDSIEFFYPRMSKGAILLCDDYGLTTCPGATRAIDEYLLDRAEKMITLDCGGGFFVKGTTTASS